MPLSHINSLWICKAEKVAERYAETILIKATNNIGEVEFYRSRIVYGEYLDLKRNTDEFSDIEVLVDDPRPFKSWEWCEYRSPLSPWRSPLEIQEGGLLVGIEWEHDVPNEGLGIYTNFGSQFLILAIGEHDMTKAKRLLGISLKAPNA